MKYFPLLYRLNSDDRYLIWISNEKDSVEVDAEGFVTSFRDAVHLRAYADAHGYRLEGDEPILDNLDLIAEWVKMPVQPVDCGKALHAWNLFSDVAHSIPEKGIFFQQLDCQPTIYEKLFWGNNLRALTPVGKHYTPKWSSSELTLLAEILDAGLGLFQSCIRSCQPSDY